MAESSTVKLALVQHACPVGRAAGENVERCCALVREAASSGAQVVVTQELFATSYFPREEDGKYFELAEPVPGPTTRRMGRLAKELDIEIVASVFERRTEGVYHNTLVLIAPSGEIAGRYRKMHIPDDPGFYEKYYFTPGDLGFMSWAGASLNIGPLVCWDQWFPEAARLTAMRGAQLLLYPTAIGWLDSESEQDHRRQYESWVTIQKSHAIANGVYVAAVNRVGGEGEITFWGSSFVCDPTGQVIAQASGEQERVLLAELDLGLIAAQRRGWPFLRDRRVDEYGGLTARMLDE